MRNVNFNSIKVRLEPACLWNGDIDLDEFQFHKGTIRTHVAEQVSKEILNFNSIKVRLEPLNRVLIAIDIQQFQFHKGTIRTQQLHFRRQDRRNFNSIKVRLELWTKPNYILTNQFQFHKGTIRTGFRSRYCRRWQISIP